MNSVDSQAVRNRVLKVAVDLSRYDTLQCLAGVAMGATVVADEITLRAVVFPVHGRSALLP